MRIVVAQFQHETNSFSPLATPLESFEPAWGAAAVERNRGSRKPMEGMLSVLAEDGHELVTPVAAWAYPSGPVAREAYEAVAQCIADAVAGGCDAIALDLHGAMVVEGGPLDAEGALVERLRGIAPDVPIAVSLDLHANVTARLAASCVILVGYKTYPHVDMFETGAHAARLLSRTLRGELRPRLLWADVPILAQTFRMNTAQGAMRALVEQARALEAQGIPAASAFGGFPLADFPGAGMSAALVIDAGDDPRAAEAAGRARLEALLARAWEARDDFVYRTEPLAESLARAAAIAAGGAAPAGSEGGHPAGPVILLDHADNQMSGGTMDSMSVLAAALAAGLDGIAAGPYRDPDAVARMLEAGLGTRVRLKVGGRFDYPALGREGEPLELEGIVREITDGAFTVSGPTFTGMRAEMGRTAVLDTGAALVVISERGLEPFDTGVFASVGIDPSRQRFLVLKSRMYFRPVFLPLARAAVEVGGIGCTSSDLALFPFSQLRRPIFPLDPDMRWSPASGAG